MSRWANKKGFCAAKDRKVQGAQRAGRRGVRGSAPEKSDRGFTLVEMVVVMAITGIVAAALLQWVDDARTETRHAAHPLVWASSASTVFAQLRRDARQSPAVVSETGLTLGKSRWTSNDGQLRRNGEVLARNVKAVRWQQNGALLTVEIDFEAQNGTYTARRTHQGQIAVLADVAGAP